MDELNLSATHTSNATYQRISLSKQEIVANHTSFMTSQGKNITREDCDLPSLYWIP